MKKFTSFFAVLFFAITTVFAQESTKTVEIDLTAGTVKSGIAKSIVWEQDSIKITQESRSLFGSTGAAASAVDVTDVSKPKLTDGQDFIFANTSKLFPNITKIEISYEGTNHGGLVVGTTRTSGKVNASASCVTNLSTAENGTHTIQIIGDASTLYVQNYNPTPLHVTKITVTRAIAGYVEEEEAQTDTATVTTINEAMTALGTRTSVVVLFQHLQPVTKVASSTYTDYMPDGTTKLSSHIALPADFDCYGTLSRGENGYTFSVDSIVGLYAFNNTYVLKSYYDQNKQDPNIKKELNITEPVTVTAVEGANVFVQYNYARNEAIYSDQLIISGEHNLKVGDQIANFTAKYNTPTKLTLDEETTQLANNEFFAVAASSLGSITADNAIKYKSISNISNLESNAATAVQLPKTGAIAKVEGTYYFVLGKDSLVVRPAAGINLDAFVGSEANLSIKGVIDYCNTATGSKAFILTHIKEINTNFTNIAEWLQSACEGEGEGKLVNPVIVTHSEFKNSKQFVFVGDETGGLCLTSSEKDTANVFKVGNVIEGIAGNINLSDTEKAPQLTLSYNLAVVDSGKTLEPVVVTIEQLLAEENDALNNGIPAIKYANRLVKINKTTRSASWVNGNPRIYGLVQGEKTLPYSTNTLNAYHSKFSTTTPMSVTGIADFRTINNTNLYSIYPRSTEDVQDDFDQPVISPAPGIYTEEIDVTITCSDKFAKTILYTLDPEVDPTIDGEVYEEPITVSENTTIFYAVEYEGEKFSKVYTATYEFLTEVTSMDELKDAEGTRVLYKGLEPKAVTVGEGWMAYTEYFMPDGETRLSLDAYVVPAKLDVYGTLEEGVFTVDAIDNIHAFFNMGDLNTFMQMNPTEEQKAASYEVKEPVVVTLASMMSFYVQYEAQSMWGGASWNGLQIQAGRMSRYQAKAGDAITLKGVYSPAVYNEETGALEIPAYFALEDATLVSENNKLNYASIDPAYIDNYYASLGRLPKGGAIAEDDYGYYFVYEFSDYVENPETGWYEEVIVKDSLQLFPAGPVDLSAYVGKELDKLVAGVADFDPSSGAPIFYVTELQESKLYYNNIAELIAAGSQTDYSLSSVLRNPVLLTYISYNQWAGYTIFVQDETGAIAIKGLGVLDEEDNYTFPYDVKPGDMITGVEGFTSLGEAAPYMWSGADYQVNPKLAKASDGVITPLDITMAQFCDDIAAVTRAMMSGDSYASPYANRVVRIQESLIKYVDPEDEKWPYLRNGDNEFQVSTYYWGNIEVPEEIISLTGIVDYGMINGNGTPTIQPLNAESVVAAPKDPVNVEYVTLDNITVENGTIVLDGEFQIYTITGQNVTNMNGRLVNGVYVVRTADAFAKVFVK